MARSRSSVWSGMPKHVGAEDAFSLLMCRDSCFHSFQDRVYLKSVTLTTPPMPSLSSTTSSSLLREGTPPSILSWQGGVPDQSSVQNVFHLELQSKRSHHHDSTSALHYRSRNNSQPVLRTALQNTSHSNTPIVTCRAFASAAAD